MRYGMIFVVMGLLVFVVGASHAQRDPFNDAAKTKPSAPLHAYPLTSIAVVGIIITTGKKLAIVRTPAKTFHIIKAGSLLGQEKRPVAAVDGRGVHFDDSGIAPLLPPGE